MNEKKPKPKQRLKAIPLKEKIYEKDYSWKPSNLKDAKSVRTTTEMVAFLESKAGKEVEVEAKVLAYNEDGEIGFRRIGKKSFIESFKQGSKLRSTKQYRESFAGLDVFNGGNSFSSGGGSSLGAVGNDFTPLLGGPFYKQLYYYNDWLKMHQDCFFAYHHDPYAKASVNILVDFTLGKGYDVNCSNPVAQALWEAFEEANDFKNQFKDFVTELSIYGENMLWWLPDNEKYITYPRNKLNLDDVPKVFIPRVRVIDPSNIVEIITHPEDITRKIAYVWLTPTQYQIYNDKDPETGKVVDGTKLIYQHIPANQMMHYKINAVSNEKRGRSDLFTALPYFKRLRDAVNYSIIAHQKSAAWAIDTTIEGDESDLSAYVADQQALGTIPPAGSEFVHTKAVERKYIGADSSGRGISESFEWCLSMIAACVGIPVSYFGSHLSGGATRASALVSTEPVAKRFEMRQNGVYRKVIEDIANRLFKHFGIETDIEVVFPEIITQDRSAKLKDIFLAETAKWISPERASTMGAQELGITDFSYDQEKEDINSQQDMEAVPPMANPLTAVPGVAQSPAKPSAVTGEERKDIKDNNG